MCIRRAVHSRLQHPPWPSLSTFLTELIILKGPAQCLPPLSRTSKKQISLFLSLLEKKKEQELTETGDSHILHLSGCQHLAWSRGLNPSVRTLLSPPSCSLALHSLESNRKKAPDGGYIKEKQQKVWEVQTSPSRSQTPSAFPTIYPSSSLSLWGPKTVAPSSASLCDSGQKKKRKKEREMWEAKSVHQLNLTPNKEPMGKLQPGLPLASHGLELCLGDHPSLQQRLRNGIFSWAQVHLKQTRGCVRQAQV